MSCTSTSSSSARVTRSILSAPAAADLSAAAGVSSFSDSDDPQNWRKRSAETLPLVVGKLPEAEQLVLVYTLAFIEGDGRVRGQAAAAAEVVSALMILASQRGGHTILIFALLVLAIRTSRVTEVDQQHVHSVFRREIQMGVTRFWKQSTTSSLPNPR